MKTALALVLPIVFIALNAVDATVSGEATKAQDRTVTKVVKMLEAMLEKSKADGDKDREIYAKFLCYCNTKKEAKTNEIADLTETIAQLENTIAELKGSNGELSTAAAKLKMDIFNNEAEQAQLTQLRKDENTAYEALKADSEFAIGQMNEAIATLAEVGADQTLGEAAADHKQFMAKFSGVELSKKSKAKISEALKAAEAFMEEKQRKSVQSLLQAPFTGTYTAQSGEVVGILKQMRNTFTEVLEKATAAEEAAQKIYDETMEVKKSEHKTMSDLKAEKEAMMGENDGELATRTSQLETAKQEKATREEFLADMIPMCEAKTKEYGERNMMRANEDAAISKAISILNADSAFATFGTVDATSSGAAFLQLKSVEKHDPQRLARKQVQQLLQQAARKHKSMRLVKIAALLEAGNPFTKVLEAIKKLVAIIAAEGVSDKENLDWCNTEREESDATLKELDAEILMLEDTIAKLIDLIEAPVKGLKAQIETTELALHDNYNSQVEQTSQRQEANQAYQADIANLVEAEDLLTAAINVLTKYYDTIGPDVEMEAPKVLAGETEAVPTTFHEEKGYKGQSSAGTEVIKMLTFILDNTKKEEAFAHTSEHDSQHAYEDSMEALKTEEAELQATLARLQEELAEAEQKLAQAKKELKAAEEHHAAVTAYLLDIKPGCDFITENIGYRDDRRASETDALLEAEQLLMGTPVYKAAVAEAALEALGDCRETCVENGEENVKCKACLAKVEIPGYCAGHPDTEGC